MATRLPSAYASAFQKSGLRPDPNDPAAGAAARAATAARSSAAYAAAPTPAQKAAAGAAAVAARKPYMGTDPYNNQFDVTTATAPEKVHFSGTMGATEDQQGIANDWFYKMRPDLTRPAGLAGARQTTTRSGSSSGGYNFGASGGGSSGGSSGSASGGGAAPGGGGYAQSFINSRFAKPLSNALEADFAGRIRGQQATRGFGGGGSATAMDEAQRLQDFSEQIRLSLMAPSTDLLAQAQDQSQFNSAFAQQRSQYQQTYDATKQANLSQSAFSQSYFDWMKQQAG